MQLCNPIGYVHSLETFGSVDGPGVRFVVFFRRGAPCGANTATTPETWAEGGEEWTVDKLFQRVWRYRNYWGKKWRHHGQAAASRCAKMEFLTAFFELARSKGVHTPWTPPVSPSAPTMRLIWPILTG